MGFFARLFGRDTSQVVSDPAKVPAAFKQIAPVLDEIGAEAIGCIPEYWTSAILTITCDGRRIDYSLKNHHGGPGTAQISPQLAQLAEKLYVTMAQNGNRWTKAELSYEKDGKAWKFRSEFSYD
jgi:hypothetical protein